jgi:NTP pyrophosphatase (non-canonical NTP hydrolase)
MDVKALQARLAAFAAERGWDGAQNPRNLAIAIAGEAGMLLDLFRWLSDAQSQRIESEYKREAAEEAIADLILHSLRLADKLAVDVERAIAKKLAENEANYPRPAAEQPVAAAARAQPRADETTASPAKPVEAKLAAAAPEGATPSAPKPAEAKPAPSPVAAHAPEPPTPAEKAIPTWLDGILPSRGALPRRKHGGADKAASEPTPTEVPRAVERATAPRKPEPVPPPPEPEQEIEAAPPPEPEGEIEAAPPPQVPPAPIPARREPPPPERYVHLDTDAAKVLAKSLAKKVDGARSEDPLLRELHDEVETLRRTLYSPLPKTSWMGESLKTIRALLEEAATHDVGEVIRARDYVAQIDRMLAP